MGRVGRDHCKQIEKVTAMTKSNPNKHGCLRIRRLNESDEVPWFQPEML